MIVRNAKVRPGDPLRLLYVEPQEPPSEQPVIDVLTRGMAAGLDASEAFDLTRGFHVCSCGARSDNCEHKLPTGDVTNSLAVHYLAYHRHEIGPWANEVVPIVHRLLQLHGLKETEPTSEQLQKPDPSALTSLVADYHRTARRKRDAARPGKGV